MLSVKDFQVAGAEYCRVRRLLPTQTGDKPLASRSLRPRYIFAGRRDANWRFGKSCGLGVTVPVLFS